MLKYMLDTNNTREFERVPGIRLSDWTISMISEVSLRN